MAGIVVGRALVALGIVVAPATPGWAQSADELSEETREYVSVDAPVVALRHVRLIDGTDADAREGWTVVLRDGRIAAVGPDGETSVPEGAESIDLAGHTVIPGLVGLHDHLFYTAAGGRRVQLAYSAPRLYLGSGVTTVRTTGSFTPFADLNLKAAIDAGRSPGPRIHVTAPYITGDEGPGYKAQLTSPEQARRFVRYWGDEGATWLKAYTTIGREELAAAISEAHERGMKVTGHLCSVTFREAVELGIDNLEHGMLTASDFVPDKRADACPGNLMQQAGESDPTGETAGATIRAMVEAGVGMTSTLAVYEPFFPDRPVTDERALELMAPEIREAYLETRARIEEIGPDPAYLARAMAFEKAFFDAGGLLAAGVDPTGIGGALPGLGDQRNYELLVEAGFTPTQAVRVMTANGARILGEEERIGTAEVGKVADLVVLAGDLTRDPTTIRRVRLVFKEGVGYDPDALVEDTKGLVGIR